MLGQRGGTSGMVLSGEGGTARGLGNLTLIAGDGGGGAGVRSSRRQVLNVVVACGIGAVSGLPGLEVLFGVLVHLFVAEHNSAVGAVVGDVVIMHSTVEPMVGRFGLWDLTNVGSRR